MVTFLKKLQEKDKGDLGPVFLRSHPYTSQRIQLMEKELPSIKSKVDAKANQNIQSPVSNTSKPPQIQVAAKSEKDESLKLPVRVMCKKCRRIFPGTVNYCPYDGTALR